MVMGVTNVKKLSPLTLFSQNNLVISDFLRTFANVIKKQNDYDNKDR